MKKEIWNKAAWLLFMTACISLFFLGFFLFFMKEKPSKARLSVPENTTPVVLGGLEFYVPSVYTCITGNDEDILIYQEDSFKMRVQVSDTSFEERLSKKEEKAAELTEAGCRLIGKPEEKTLGNHLFLCYTLYMDDSIQYLIYVSSINRKCIGTLISMEDKDLQQALQILDSIFGLVQETEKADSTIYDLMFYQTDLACGRELTAGVIEIPAENRRFTYPVPEGYHSDGSYSDAETYSETLHSSGDNIRVNISLVKGDAAYIKEQMSEGLDRNEKLEETEILDRTVCYSESDQTYILEDTIHIYSFKAMLDLEGYGVYSVSGWSYTNPSAAELETYLDFLMPKEDSGYINKS